VKSSNTMRRLVVLTGSVLSVAALATAVVVGSLRHRQGTDSELATRVAGVISEPTSASVLSASPRGSTATSRSGLASRRVAFVLTRNEDCPEGECGFWTDIYTVDASGGNRTLLLGNGFAPAYWHQGDRVAFVDEARIGIFLASANGADRTRLTPPSLDTAISPTWSPDDTLVAFAAWDTQRIYIIPSSGGPVTLLTRGEDPAWSSTGVVAFVRTRNFARGRIAVIAGSGGHVRYLTSGRSDTTPDWSPDGLRLAFVRQRRDNPQWIYAMTERGTDLRRLARGFDPRWSPDGRHIAYISPDGGSVRVMRPDGRAVRTIASIPPRRRRLTDFSSPRWVPSRVRTMP
jgi:Tol biopolymer transport system component